MLSDELDMRAARDSDAGDLIDLIGGCFSQYEGIVLDLDDMDAPLKAIASYVAAGNGEFWLIYDGRNLVASCGYIQDREDRIELVKLYVRSNQRRKGLASQLLGKVLKVAEDRGLGVDLWTDTRFLEAHQFYAQHGFVRQTDTRSFDDPSNTSEYQFILE